MGDTSLVMVHKIKPSITTDYNDKVTKFIMDIPTSYLFLTPEISDYYAQMQQVKISRSEILLVMAKMVRLIEEEILHERMA